MTVGELIERVNKGVSLPQIFEKELHVARTTVPTILKRLGYIYHAGKWHFVGEGQPPSNDNILDYVERSKETSSSVKHTAINMWLEAISILPEKKQKSSFSDDDIHDLQVMLKEWREQKAVQPAIENLTSRLPEIPKEKTKNRTFAIPVSIIETLNTLAQRHRIHKSDVLTLALLDFIEQYK